MRITITKITTEIAKTLSLKHQKDIAYKIMTQNDFGMIIGLCVEPLFSASMFCVSTFIQPLYIPRTIIILNLSERIDCWERTDLSLAMPIIENAYKQLPCDSITTIIDMVNNHRLPYRVVSFITKYEFLAYSYLAINQYDEAKKYLIEIVAFEKQDHRDWVKDYVKRAKKLLDLMEQENWTEIRNLLLSWQRETMTALKLPD